MPKVTEGTLALLGNQSGHNRRTPSLVVDEGLISDMYPISNYGCFKAGTYSGVVLRLQTDPTMNIITARSNLNKVSQSYSGLIIRI